MLRAAYAKRPTLWEASKLIIAAAGSTHPSRLSKAQAIEIDARLAQSGLAQSTKAQYAAKVRQIMNWLSDAWGTERLASLIRKYPGVRPRNVTLSRDEIEGLLRAAHRGLRLWLLLCSDMAMRSGTAARIGPGEYNPQTRAIRFTTKAGAKLTLPVTEEVRLLIEQCDQAAEASYVYQLWPRRSNPTSKNWRLGATPRDAFRNLLTKANLSRRVTPHDLRRTTAVAILEATHDLRDVQAVLGHRSLNSTLHYLDHDLRPVKRSLLETIKRPAWAERKQA